jgi:hypothetical protein
MCSTPPTLRSLKQSAHQVSTPNSRYRLSRGMRHAHATATTFLRAKSTIGLPLVLLTLWTLLKTFFYQMLPDVRKGTTFWRVPKLRPLALVRRIWVWKANENDTDRKYSGKKPNPVLLCPLKTSHGLTQNRTETYAMSGRRPTTLIHSTARNNIKKKCQRFRIQRSQISKRAPLFGRSPSLHPFVLVRAMCR